MTIERLVYRDTAEAMYAEAQKYKKQAEEYQQKYEEATEFYNDCMRTYIELREAMRLQEINEEKEND